METLKEKQYLKPISMQDSNPFNFPLPFENIFESYRLPFHKNWLLASDAHVPYHSIRALSELINYGIGKGVDAVLLDGDIMDCYHLSKFSSDPSRPSTKEEIDMTIEFLEVLKKATGAKIYYKFGNHEVRLEYFLRRKAPELLGLKEFRLEKLLKLESLGVTFIPADRIAYIGNLPVLHGHEIHLKSAIVNPARSLFLKTFRSCICGHLHVPSQHNETALDGRTISTWSLGHLSDPHPEYAPYNKWVHGGARVEVDESGDYEVINLRLIGNKIHRT